MKGRRFIGWVFIPAILSIVLAHSQAGADEPVIFHLTTVETGVEALEAPVQASSRGNSTMTTGFSLTYGAGLAGNQAAKDAFDRAAARWSALLCDPVTVAITVDYQSLGSGILGQSSTSMMYGGFNVVRNLVAGGGEAGDAREAALLPNLPTATQFSAYLPSGFSMDGYSELSKANYRALGGSPSGSDGSITFSSNYAWDFHPEDGVGSGLYDFEGVAVHEMGHILGFLSEVDYVDGVLNAGGTASDVWPMPLDYFRFRTSDLGAGFNFTTTPRNLSPGGSDSFYYLDGSALMSTGQYYGDGRQASHWKDGLGLGVMDPTAAPGERLLISANDLTALDLIGWDVVPEPATMSLLALGGLVVLRRGSGRVLRRRKRALATSQ